MYLPDLLLDNILTLLYRLNLTIANCVYILEPQWNPMVESQAIARVLRIGQNRDVNVVRYIMKGTVEEVGIHHNHRIIACTVLRILAGVGDAISTD
jgi:hypothetical protein